MPSQNIATRTAAQSTKRTLVLTGAASASLLLAACSSPSSQPSSTSAAPTQSASSSSSAMSTASASSSSSAVTVSQPWVKAAMNGKMTGVFGVIENKTGQEIHIVKAHFEKAGMVELHETITTEGGGSKMQEATDGFRIKAGETFELKPGANHIMLMGLTSEIKAGEAYTVTLELEDGTTIPFEATARDFSGAQETYKPSTEKPMPSMSMTPSPSHTH